MQAAHSGNQTIWKQVYTEALFELDPRLFQCKIQTARAAVDARLWELRSEGERESREVLELTDAHRVLRYLQKLEQQT
jgi:multidrug resistance efflux pump